MGAARKIQLTAEDDEPGCDEDEEDQRRYRRAEARCDEYSRRFPLPWIDREWACKPSLITIESIAHRGATELETCAGELAYYCPAWYDEADMRRELKRMEKDGLIAIDRHPERKPRDLTIHLLYRRTSPLKIVTAR